MSLFLKNFTHDFYQIARLLGLQVQLHLHALLKYDLHLFELNEKLEDKYSKFLNIRYVFYFHFQLAFPSFWQMCDIHQSCHLGLHSNQSSGERTNEWDVVVVVFDTPLQFVLVKILLFFSISIFFFKSYSLKLILINIIP